MKNMKKFKYLALAVTLLAASLFPAHPTDAAEDALPYVATVFNERNGLPTGEANDVLQTSDGYIWVGSYGGLIRYDGTNFRNFSTEGILSSSSVRMMYEDSKGRLWIGTNDAGVFIYEKDQITRPEGQPDNSFLCVRGFAEDENGVIYACSNSGVAQISDGKMTVYTDPELSGLTVYSIAVDRYNRVWCADSTGGCKVLSGGKVVCSFTGAEIFGENGSVYSVTTGLDGEVWIGSSTTSLANITFQGEGFSGSDYDISLGTAADVSTHNSLRMMKDGTLLISGQHGLAVRSADGAYRAFYEKDGADSANSAFIDYEGNIWIASSNRGIVRFSRGCYTSPNADAGLEGLSLNTVAVSDGTRYIGTDSGLIICDRNWNRVENELTALYNGERKIRIRHITTDQKGCVWIAAHDIPVVRYDPKTNDIRIYTTDDGIVSSRARVLLALSDGKMAVGTQNGLNILSENGVETSYTDFAYPAILSLLETKDGSLYAGSDGGGIYEIKNGKVVNHSFSEGLSEGVVLRMLSDETRGGYFISAGSSLYFWKDGAFRKLSNIRKEPGSIFDFYLTDGTIWLLQNNGILASDIDDLLADGTGNPVTYSFAHGLSGSLNANTWHSLTGGKLYLATRNGVSIFNFQSPEYVLPKCIINSITIDGTLYEHPESLEIPSGAKRITIDFAALSYTDTAPISIAYRLAGFEDTETVLENTKSGSVSYTNLPGGKYTFQLKVLNPEHPQGDTPLRIGLKKEKRLTERLLFKVCVIVLSLAAVIGFVLFLAEMRLIRAKKRQQEYRDILEQSLLTFAGTIDAKDKYTNGHSTRVAQYSRELAKRMGFSEEEQENIYYVALLHDIGKIGIPDNILNKPGKLSDEEWKTIQKHPDIGAEILKNFTALSGIADGAKYHHERYDGTGYTEGRAGSDIPLVARIICVADTYDAMSSERCYRKPLTRETILAEFEKGTGTQFDPEIVPHIVAMIQEGVVPFR